MSCFRPASRDGPGTCERGAFNIKAVCKRPLLKILAAFVAAVFSMFFTSAQAMAGGGGGVHCGPDNCGVSAPFDGGDQSCAKNGGDYEHCILLHFKLDGDRSGKYYDITVNPYTAQCQGNSAISSPQRSESVNIWLKKDSGYFEVHATRMNSSGQITDGASLHGCGNSTRYLYPATTNYCWYMTVLET